MINKLRSMPGLIVGMTMVLSLVGGNGIAQAAALTSAQVSAIVSLLQSFGADAATVANVQATLSGSSVSVPASTVSSGYAFAKDLTVGSKGADVTALQSMLGVTPATGYFGSITKAAVIKYQLAKSITPAAGYVGAKTRASLNGGGLTTTPTSGYVGITGTDLKIALAATSPASGAVVAGQAAADLAEFTFTNTSAVPAVVTNVSLMRGGVSADTSLVNVYLYNGAVRLTDAASVSTGKITFNSGAGLFIVPAGTSMTIAVKADILSTANGQLVSIALTGVIASVPVSAVYPVSGAALNIFSSTDIAAATSTLSAGTLAGGSIQAGSLNQTIWSTSLSLSGRAVYLKSLAVKVIGSVPSDALQNLKLYVSGVQVASSLGQDSNGIVTFDLSSNPYKIDSSRTIEVRADVIKGSSRTFSVTLQNASDLQIIDSNYNVGIAVQIPATQSSGTWLVSTGSVTVTLDTSLSSGDVITGASNVPLSRYTLKAYGEDMKISYLYASSTDTLDNVAMYANGSQIGSTQTISTTAGAGKLYNLGSSLIIPAGTSVTLEIRGDIKYNGTNATTTANTIVVSLAGYANNTQGSYSSALTTVPATSGVAGPTMTVKAAGVSFAANPNYSNQTAVPNTSNVKLGSYVLQTTSVEPVRITGLTVTLGGDAGTSTNVSNLRTSMNANDVKGSPSASNNFTVDFTIPANSSQTIDVYGDLATVQDVASTTMTITGYGTNSNTTLAQKTVYGQTVTVGAGALATPTLKAGSGYSPVAQFVVGNSTFVTGVYNFKSSNGASTITELTFAASGTAANITNVSVGGQSAPMVDSAATITGLNITVPVSNSGTNVPVTVSYPTVGLGGVDSGYTAGLELTGMKYMSGNSTVSTTTLAVDTNLMTLVGSKPILTFNDVTTSVSTGQKEIARYTIGADAKGEVDLVDLPLSVTTTGNAELTSANLAVYSNGSLLAYGTDYTDSLGAVGTSSTATGTIIFAEPVSISAGNSTVLKIYANVVMTASNLSSDSITTTIGDASLFQWKDVLGGITEDGLNILNYPTVQSSTLTNL